MNKMIFGFLILAAFLASCSNAPAAVPQTQTSEVSETSEVLPAPTETRVPPTATATPIPTYSIEQLTAMSPADKLAMAPQAGTAPADVVASFLPKGADVANVVWGEKTLTYWERVVSYHGKAGGQEVTLYYDLESGQWAKRYDSFKSLSEIPADQVPDVMVLGLGDDLGDRLIRNKLQYNYDWISQPQAMTEDGKMIFRDEKGYPKAVFDTANQKWLTPEQADVVITLGKWKEFFDLTYIGPADGKTYNANWIFDKDKSQIMTNPTEIENLPNATPMVILNPSGEITIWSSQIEAAQRAREGGIILVSLIGKSNHSQGWVGAKVAFDQHQKGNKTIYLTYNDVGVKESEISGVFYPMIAINLDDIPKIKNNLSPVVRMPKHFSSYFVVIGKLTPIPVNITNPDFWLDEIIQAGANDIHVFNIE